VVRLSGPHAVSFAASLIRDCGRIEQQPSHTVRRVALVDPTSGAPLDDALCTVMRTPRSYTGEDVVELSCHGSPPLLRCVLERLVRRGARLAEPGEFTRRAFLNGRLDLAQAEAVALLIGARTERAVALAARAVAGEHARVLRGFHSRLLDVIAGLEVTLDFPDDTVGVDPHDAVPTLRALAADVAAWRARAQRGRMVHEGLTIAIVGTPNAGKSSLLNALVGRERAIVSPLAGTTRDVVEATIELGGIPVRLLDTAGIDEPRDVLEAEGIKRSRAAIAESDLLLVVVDASRPLISDVLLETAHMPRVIVRAKTDLTPHPSTCSLDAVAVSVVTGVGLEELIRRIAAEVERRSDDGAEALLVSVRQMDALERLERALRMGADALPDAPIEVALVELRDALRESSALLGEGVGEAVLDRIFATFCVGK
jgi:tRNA modification GTPase